MNLTINANHYKFIRLEIDSTQRKTISSLSIELIIEIISYLNFKTLGTIASVSREWKHLASEPVPWKKIIYREIAFGNDKWAQYFGKEVVKDENPEEEFLFLPWREFIKDCKKFKNIFPEKNVKECLMLVMFPKTLNGKLSLKTLEEFTWKHFSEKALIANETGYTLYSYVDELTDTSIHQSLWVLMTRKILPDSINKSYAEQQVMVASLDQKGLSSYEIPNALEAAVCLLTQSYLFSDWPQFTYTHCKDSFRGYQTQVGCFCLTGLTAQINFYNSQQSGIATLRKF